MFFKLVLKFKIVPFNTSNGRHLHPPRYLNIVHELNRVYDRKRIVVSFIETMFINHRIKIVKINSVKRNGSVIVTLKSNYTKKKDIMNLISFTNDTKLISPDSWAEDPRCEINTPDGGEFILELQNSSLSILNAKKSIFQ